MSPEADQGGQAAGQSPNAPGADSGGTGVSPVSGDEFSDRLQQQLGRSQAESSPAAAEATPETTEQAPDESAGPVGSGEHVVRQGECISSIAKDTGHFWETIWNDGGNTELREARQDPNVLLPEDRVTVPEKRRKDEPIAAEQRHRFVRRGEPVTFRLRVLENNEPRANQPYVAEIDGREYRDVTDADGKLQIPVPANVRQGRLRVGSGEDVAEFGLRFRHLNPVSELTGVQQRLENLAFDCGPADGQLGPRTRSALTRFQEKHGLEATGEPDTATKDRLKEVHGS